MRSIRRIFLTDYIGAILIAVLITDAVAAIITTAIGQISYYVQFRSDPLANAHRISTAYSLLGALARVALYLAVAYLVARWLYPDKFEGKREAKNEDGV
jgi:hypothetical protein